MLDEPLVFVTSLVNINTVGVFNNVLAILSSANNEPNPPTLPARAMELTRLSEVLNDQFDLLYHEMRR